MLSEASPLADLGPGSATQDVDIHEYSTISLLHAINVVRQRHVWATMVNFSKK